MMNLISFETPPPPLGKQESAGATAATFKLAKEASSSGTCFHGSHLDLSLGISLSPGSGAGCGCGGASVTSYTGRRGVGDVGGTQSSAMVTTTAIANTLSAGHGGNLHGIVSSSSSWTAAFMPSPTGFMHPWSLAARQQKAAAEQDRSLAPAPAASTYVTSDASAVSLTSAAVGWPPVHTSRRNLVTATHAPKPDADLRQPDGPKDAKMAAATADDKDVATVATRGCTATAELRRRPENMFAKVHMDGCLIGRKINLRAHRSYDSLSRALTKMTRNFFCPADYPCSESREEECANSDDFIFLYEDFEGDRMLVGDVPWGLFLASAKKLYIARHPAFCDTKATDYPCSESTEEECANSDDFIFLYEDFEGDRMLVGDVPWELFLASAKKLYIARHPAFCDTKAADYPCSESREEECANSDDFIFLYEDFEGDRMFVGDVPWGLFLASAKKLYIARHPAFCDTKAADYPCSESREEECANSDDFIFLYEDFEGDRMLVGDIPWGLFLASAKKLYIARHPAFCDTKGHDKATKIDASENL